MKNIFLILSLSITIFSTISGQNNPSAITIRKGFSGYQFYQGPQRLKMKQLVNVMSDNPQAYKEVKVAQSNYAWTGIIGGVGGFLIGWPIGTAIAGGDPAWELAGIGAGLSLISIPFSATYKRKARSAIDIYNKDLTSTGLSNEKTEFKLCSSGNSFGLIATF